MQRWKRQDTCSAIDLGQLLVIDASYHLDLLADAVLHRERLGAAPVARHHNKPMVRQQLHGSKQSTRILVRLEVPYVKDVTIARETCTDRREHVRTPVSRIDN